VSCRARVSGVIRTYGTPCLRKHEDLGIGIGIGGVRCGYSNLLVPEGAGLGVIDFVGERMGAGDDGGRNEDKVPDSRVRLSSTRTGTPDLYAGT